MSVCSLPVRRRAPGTAVVALGLLATAGAAQDHGPRRSPDVHYVPTPPAVVNAMLHLARVTKDDVVYDLGSGDGRIVITAASKHGARGVGIDIDPQRIKEARANAESAGVADRVKFLEQDLFQTDVSPATVVTLYLLPSLNVKLRPTLLRSLQPGTRVVSHAFDMGEWEPDQRLTVGGNTVYFWLIPADVSGTWTWEVPGASSDERYTARLEQTFQTVKGLVAIGRDTMALGSARLAGDTLRFTVFRGEGEVAFEGRVQGDRITGTVKRPGASGTEPWSARRTERTAAAETMDR